MALANLVNTLLVSVVLQGLGKANVIWDHQAVLDSKGKYILYWNAKNNVVNFQIEVATQGWVGFGLSPDGEFEGSDLLIARVKQSKDYITSYHVTENGKMVSASNLWISTSAFEDKGKIIVKFTKKFGMCHPETWLIPGTTYHILYAYPGSEMQSPDESEMRSPDESEMRSPDESEMSNTMWQMKMLKLFQPRVTKVERPKDVKYWDFRMDNFTSPGNRDSLYGCKVIRGPQLRRKHHIIKIAPVVRPQNEEVVHHLFLNKCIVRSREEGERLVSAGTAECSNQNALSLTENCVTIYGAWGRGGGAFLFPTKVGQPIGEEPNEYFLIQIHYDNPSFENGIVDDSGLRIYYTPSLRRYDGGQLGLGFVIFSSVVIPPGQPEFTIASHLSPKCIEEPRDGIKVFAIHLHAHLLGRRITIRHFRDNKELVPLASDMHFSHHHQEYAYLKEDTIMHPGDQLTVECLYDSTSRNVTTFGQEATNDEMCSAVLYYYPGIPLFSISSSINVALVAGLTGMDLTSGNMASNPQNDYASFRRYLTNYDWRKDFICTVENAMRFSPQEAYCIMNDTRIITVPSTTYPEGVKPYRIPSFCPNSNDKSERSQRCQSRDTN